MAMITGSMKPHGAFCVVCHSNLQLSDRPLTHTGSSGQIHDGFHPQCLREWFIEQLQQNTKCTCPHCRIEVNPNEVVSRTERIFYKMRRALENSGYVLMIALAPRGTMSRSAALVASAGYVAAGLGIGAGVTAIGPTTSVLTAAGITALTGVAAGGAGAALGTVAAALGAPGVESAAIANGLIATGLGIVSKIRTEGVIAGAGASGSAAVIGSILSGLPSQEALEAGMEAGLFMVKAMGISVITNLIFHHRAMSFVSRDNIGYGLCLGGLASMVATVANKPLTELQTIFLAAGLTAFVSLIRR